MERVRIVLIVPLLLDGDGDAEVFPGASEVCEESDSDWHPGAEESDYADPNDYNCDGSVAYEDSDDDGFAACQECDDSNGSVHPDSTKICNAASLSSSRL